MLMKFWLYDCIYTHMWQWACYVFAFENETTQMISSSTKHYIYNKLLISRNKIKYMLN